jgi:hypothetical protein
MAFYYKHATDIYISKAPNASADATNTVKLKVIDFSFNQTSNLTRLGRNTINPAQDRGIALYTSVVNPVSFSITTYINPVVDTNVTSPEEYLWLSLMGVDDVGTPTPTTQIIDFADGFNVSELLNLTIWFIQPGLSEGSYRLDNAIVDSARIDIDINGLAQVVFTGRALSIVEDITPPASTDRTSIDDTEYLKTRFATVDFWYDNYAFNTPLFLINGTINIRNNTRFYGRTKLGKTKTYDGHYTGNREISGELQVYLKDGTDETIDFYNWILANAGADDYESISVRPGLVYIKLQGNKSNNFIMDMEDALFTIPRLNLQDVFSMTISFVIHETEHTSTLPTFTYKHV